MEAKQIDPVKWPPLGLKYQQDKDLRVTLAEEYMYFPGELKLCFFPEGY